MKAIDISKNGLVVEFSEEELALLGNALNEVCHGIEVPDFDLRIGTSVEDAEMILKFINSFYRKTKQLRLDEMNA